MQIKSTSSTDKALHTPWCLSILARRVSLAEYLLILRVLFPLLQVMLCTTTTARTALLLQWMRNRTMGMFILYIISPLCFWLEMTMKLALYLNYC